MTEQPGPPWKALLGKRYLQDPDKTKLHEAKLRLLHALPAEIFQGEREATLSRDVLEKILEPFRNALAAQEYIFLVRFLARGLSIGRKERGWKVAVPADLVIVPRESGRFTPQSFQELKQLRRIEKVLAQTLTLTELAPRLQLGRLLLSAIIYGGLLQRHWLVPLLIALNNRVRARGTLVWLDLERTWQYLRQMPDESDTSSKIKDKEIIVYRRWFADPLSRLLIIQWLRIPMEERTIQEHLPNPFDLVIQFLSHAGLPKKGIPSTVNVLFAMAGTRLGLTVPPFLAAYADGRINAVSVPPATWARLCCRKMVPQQLPNTDFEADEDEPGHQSWRAIAYGKAPATPGEQREFLKKFRKLVAKHGGSRHNNAEVRKNLAREVSTHGDAMCPFLHLMADWMDYNLSPKKNNTPSTVNRYLSAFSDAMLIVCGTEDLLEWEAVEFTSHYEQAIQLVSSVKEKIKARQNFGRFHQFLVHRYSAPYLAPVFFTGRSGPAETTVDANLLSQEEFDLVKEALGLNNPERPRSASAAIIAAILGFRCGLRREEVQYLRLSDIQGWHKPELVLRATPQRSLKTPDCTRRLPLYVLLTCEELAFFGQWLEQFKEPARGTLLLAVRGNPCMPLNDAVLFRPIRVAMAQVTGDETLRFHHLRHSFATWLLLRLAGDIHSLHTAAPFFQHAEFMDDRIQKLRKALLGNEHLGRKSAYAVASLCGHADLETTFTSYVHLCDWFLQRELARPEGLPSLDVDSVMALTGRSRATVFRAMETNKENGIKEWNWNSLLGNMDEFLASYEDPLLATAQERQLLAVSFTEEPVEAPWWESIQRALTMYQVRGKTINMIGTKLGLDENMVQLWLDKAAWLESLRGRINGVTGRYYRHLEMAKDDSALFPPKVKRKREERIHKRVRRGVFPQPPHYVADNELAFRMLNAFDRLNDENRSEVIKLAQLFVTTFSLQSGMLYFRQPAKALKYVEGIRLLGIRGRNIQLVDCRQNPRNKKVTRTRRAHWEKELALNHPVWKINNKAWGRIDGVGTVGVQIVNDVKGGGRTSYGFRYALYLIIIACRFEYWKSSQERLARMNLFRLYLNNIYLSKKTGKPLQKKVIQDAVSRCKRIERCLVIDLDTICVGQANSIQNLLEKIESHSDRFEFEGSLRKGIANFKNAAKRYNDFIAWELGI